MARSSKVEPRSVKPVVAGSSPAAPVLHVWVPANDVIGWAHCSVCGIIKSRIGIYALSPCSGPAKVLLR